MTKRKTKLVCVGWGILLCRSKRLWCNFDGITSWDTERQVIDGYNQSECGNKYQEAKQAGLIVAKKLWVEV